MRESGGRTKGDALCRNALQAGRDEEVPLRELRLRIARRKNLADLRGSRQRDRVRRGRHQHGSAADLEVRRGVSHPLARAHVDATVLDRELEQEARHHLEALDGRVHVTATPHEQRASALQAADDLHRDRRQPLVRRARSVDPGEVRGHDGQLAVGESRRRQLRGELQRDSLPLREEELDTHPAHPAVRCLGGHALRDRCGRGPLGQRRDPGDGVREDDADDPRPVGEEEQEGRRDSGHERTQKRHKKVGHPDSTRRGYSGKTRPNIKQKMDFCPSFLFFFAYFLFFFSGNFFELLGERFYIFKLFIDRGKTNVGNFIKCF